MQATEIFERAIVRYFDHARADSPKPDLRRSSLTKTVLILRDANGALLSVYARRELTVPADSVSA